MYNVSDNQDLYVFNGIYSGAIILWDFDSQLYTPGEYDRFDVFLDVT